MANTVRPLCAQMPGAGACPRGGEEHFRELRVKLKFFAKPVAGDR
jgi:hypothetical protein